MESVRFTRFSIIFANSAFNTLLCSRPAIMTYNENVICLQVFNHKDYASREEFDRAVSEALEAHKIDIVCLAGYMRILSSEFVKKLVLRREKRMCYY